MPAGISATAGDYIVSSGKRAFYRQVFRRFFNSYDILLAPAPILPAFGHTRQQPGVARRVPVSGNDVPYGLMFLLPSLANLTGQPSTAFPAGLSPSGQPPDCWPKETLAGT